ncbi:HD domain-containing protein [Synechococcus sp. H55.7]|uniref:HD domain-containing protein n=1 Tax=unclassified Synechococcus TaxID=2626047 RepID=UPI0039C1CB72
MSTQLTPRFAEAMRYAHRWHAAQTRKGTGIPYLSHLLAVASIALEHGADEDEAIAALLHDSLEDGPRYSGEPRAQIERELREHFGERVLQIILGCTDTDSDSSLGEPKENWKERKVAYLKHLESADASVLLVAAADKLHNVRCILRDFRQLGDQLWERFSGGKEGSLWYYRSLAEILGRRLPSRLAAELQELVAELQRAAGSEPATA